MIKSCYLPDEGLQGEDIPAHILWENIGWNEIIVSWSKVLYLKEVFNLSEGGYKKMDNKLIISSLQLDGYLGFVFGTSVVKDYKVKAEINFKFIKSGNVLFRCRKSINLFHPQLEIIKAPQEIVVRGNKPSDQIEIAYLGFGTLYIDVLPYEDNEAKIFIPEEVAETMEEFYAIFKEELEVLKNKHPKHREFLDRLISMKFDTRERYLEFFDEYLVKVKEDYQFIYDFADAFIYAFTKGPTKFEKIFLEPIINYLNSIVFKNIVLINIFKEIEVNKEPRTLKIKIASFDLLNHRYPEIVIPPLLIRGENTSSIKLHQLIKFRRG